ncbi:hypothetical protein C0993_006248 [Termitomyces sp. T159_Od127]|nr:hypothetical protein C0993_006248 [Termitomyces sp. T159_Od127]
MANLEARQQQELAALQEQQRIGQNAIAKEQARQKAAEEARQREGLERLRQQEHAPLNPEHTPLNEARAQMIIQGWQEHHRADLEEDFNNLGPQIEMPAHDDLKNICAAFAQMV